MASIITTQIRNFNIQQNKEAFSEVGADRLYLFVGRTTAWADEQVPTVPVDSTWTFLDAYRNMVGLKLINASDIITVCRRFDWEVNTIYDQFDDLVNMTNGFSIDDTSFPVFYVLTDELNVYKCIDNNGNSLSTVKPTGNSVSSFETADGYVWKYMFSLKTTDVFNFLTTDWMPVVTLNVTDGSTQWTIQQNAVPGAIESIVIEQAGLGYDDVLLPILTITGDGTGAEAAAEVDPVTGAITKIRMTNVGSGYTYADVAIDANGSAGAGGVARAIMSPSGGHGADPIEELGGYYIMVATKLEGDEGGKIPETIEFRQLGLVANPLSTTLGKRIGFSGLAGCFDIGDTVTGSGSGATGTIVSVNLSDGYMDVNVTAGSFLVGETVTSGVSSATVDYAVDTYLPLSALTAALADIISGSGKMLYLENRVKITRNVGQNELIKFVIEG